MVQRKKISLKLSQAIEGFFLEQRARGLSTCTLSDYHNGCGKLTAWLPDDPNLNEITTQDIQHLFAYLGNTPQISRSAIPRPAKPLSNKSLLNIHAGLSALWTWAIREGAADEHIIRALPRPKPEKRAIVPFTKPDIVALLAACNETRSYIAKGIRCANARPMALRDQAIIRTLLDTGIRASELCNVTIADADLENHRIKVFGKGAKERILRTGNRTTRALWRYQTTRAPHLSGAAPLFANNNGFEEPLTRRALGSMLSRCGERAGVRAVYPHRFRHTFAIVYLRSGGDAYSLQILLGHTTLDMVRRYLAIAQADVENAHRKASPVDNWRL